MAPIVPAIEPTDVTAGSTWTWTFASSTFALTEGWVLSYAIRGAMALQWSSGWVTASANTSTIVIPATSTQAIAAGVYSFARIWTGSGTYANQVYTEPLANLIIAANPVLAKATDLQDFAEAALVSVRAAYTARLAGDEPIEYSIGGRSVKKMSTAELWKELCILESRVARLRHQGKNSGFQVRFTPVSG